MRTRSWSYVLIVLTFSLIAAILVSACGAPEAPPTPVPTETPNLAATEEARAAVRETRAARSSATAEAKAVVATEAAETQEAELAMEAATQAAEDAEATTVAETRAANRAETRTAIALLPTSTPTPPRYEFLQRTNFLSFGDTTNLVGTIRYNGKEPIGSIDIVGTLQDASENPLAIESALTHPYHVKPGGLIPYRITYFNGPTEWASSVVEIQSQPVGDFNLFMSDFTFEQTRLTAPTGRYDGWKLIGRVVNTGSTSASNIGVIGVLYDSKGEILEVDTGYAKLSSVPPGSDSPFEIEFEPWDDAASYELVASGIIQR